MALESCNGMRVLTPLGPVALALVLLLATTSAWATVPLPERNPVREAELPLPERNPVREAEMPLPERNPVREAELPLPERNPLRVAPESSTASKDEKRGTWPKLLPGTPEVLKTWTEEEINAERARCTEVLKEVEAETEPADPVRDGGCGSPAPVKLISIGKMAKVSVSPPATMTCDLVVALAQWMEKDVQPTARRLLGKPVTKISNISDYSCRNAPGRTTTRLSEHALANALDVRDFITADGEVIDLKRDWGPTARDIAAQIAAEKAAEAARKAAAAAAEAAAKLAKEAAAKAAAEKAAKGKGETKIDAKADPKAGATVDPKGKSAADPKATPKEEPKVEPKQEAAAEDIEDLSPRERRRLKRAERQKARQEAKDAAKDAARIAREKPLSVIPVSASLAAAAQKPGPRGQFLREIHEAACGTFGTVLGPEANEAHRDHFHLDMAKRRYKSFCE
jgi:hypothetical protein